MEPAHAHAVDAALQLLRSTSKLVYRDHWVLAAHHAAGAGQPPKNEPGVRARLQDHAFMDRSYAIALIALLAATDIDEALRALDAAEHDYGLDDRVFADGRDEPLCSGCHGTASSDHVLTEWPP